MEARKPRVIVDHPSNAKSVEYAGILGDAWELFERKSKDYTNSGGQVFEDSGLMGQFMKMRDKISKLKKPLWDAEILRLAEEHLGGSHIVGSAREELGLEFENAEEILMDLIGHSLLAISVLRKRDEAYKTSMSQFVDQFVDSSYKSCDLTTVDMNGTTHRCTLPTGHPERLCREVVEGRPDLNFQWKKKL